ncbi:MAG: ribonuclease III domain-containing protein [Bacillota bacterium]|nr:ribonuclease III domain-containing protein [Bacillota bacterium]
MSTAKEQGWRQLPVATLAYLGDAVFELYVRHYLISRGEAAVDRLHRLAVAVVQAKAQARILRALQGVFSEEEREVARRGRNAHLPLPRGVRAQEYRHSTAWEAVVGYLYLTGQQERLEELLQRAVQIGLESEEG